MAEVLDAVGPKMGATPLTYTLAELGTVDFQAAFASFNGVSASGAFEPVLTIRSQNGTIIARSKPATAVAAGASADISWFRGLTSLAQPTGATVFGLSTVPSGGPDGSTNLFLGWSIVSRVTTTGAGVLTSLNARFMWTSGTPAATLVLYADSAGSPGALLANTPPLTIPTTPTLTWNPVNYTGMSLPLAAGTYWVGWITAAEGAASPLMLGGAYAAKSTGMNPATPNDPFPTPDATGADTYVCWITVALS